MCHVIHMDESCRTYGWVMSHIWISYITHMEQSWHTECWIFEWSAGCMSMRQVTHVNESCDTLESVTSHILISHVIQTESCHMTCGIGDCLDVCVLCVSCVLDVHVHRCLFVVASWYVSCLFPSLLLSLCLSPPPPIVWLWNTQEHWRVAQEYRKTRACFQILMFSDFCWHLSALLWASFQIVIVVFPDCYWYSSIELVDSKSIQLRTRTHVLMWDATCVVCFALVFDHGTLMHSHPHYNTIYSYGVATVSRTD